MPLKRILLAALYLDFVIKPVPTNLLPVGRIDKNIIPYDTAYGLVPRVKDPGAILIIRLSRGTIGRHGGNRWPAKRREKVWICRHRVNTVPSEFDYCYDGRRYLAKLLRRLRESAGGENRKQDEKHC